MERVKRTSLKKSFFTITACFLLAAVLLGALAFIACIELRNQIGISDGYSITIGYDRPTDVNPTYADKTKDWQIQALSILQIVLPVLFVIAGLLSADIVFYRKKLKRPLSILQNGAKRIERQDLEFIIERCSEDELGDLCTSFEAMRYELLNTQRALWQQMEERKRLNAAFSHDLRNPVTVLKGSAKMLQKSLSQGDLTSENANEAVSLIAEYAGRIETYVEAMTSAQKLEEVQVSPRLANWTVLADEIKSSLSILSTQTGKAFAFSCHGDAKQIVVDKSIIQNTAENLVSNALRFAKTKIVVDLAFEEKKLVFSVSDDGPGFSPVILSKGAEPFLRDADAGSQDEHFGMGLYICRLMCEKHGGSLALKNTTCGAKATATFFFFKA